MPISDFKDEERLTKLKGKSYEEALKLIYEWVKKDIITFKMFSKYVSTINGRKEIEADEWN